MKTEKDLLQEAAKNLVYIDKQAIAALNEPFEIEGARQIADFFNESKTDQELHADHVLMCQKNSNELTKKRKTAYWVYATLFDGSELELAYQAELKKQGLELDSELI